MDGEVHVVHTLERGRAMPSVKCKSFHVNHVPSFPFRSHVLLVVNSSTNMIIYCSLNRTFRVHLVKMVE